ncbi:phage tail tape measure protein [Laribacter hongkongensis]|uniref:phage tail tape measure protein n=1 Tax=Laribacter hongkongensis TaxID=168471 RepID=UPI000418132A|nr:phage tail tape measure protein [Laribacter hongkongensis]
MDLVQFGVVLKAFDQMSGVFAGASSKSVAALGRIDQKMGAISDRFDRFGAKLAGDGAMLTGLMQKPVSAFMEAEDAATGLKVAMMGVGGEVDKQFGSINNLAVGLGNKLPGTTADFQNMMSALIKQGVSYDAILGGVGEAAAYLGVLLKKPPQEAAEFAAKLQDATGTSEKDMLGLMDTVQRMANLGMKDSDMLSFFSKMGPAMDTMRRKGIDVSKELAPFGVMFDQMGMQGEAAGNALRKVVQLGMDAKKVGKVNDLLSKKGIKLDFTDGKGEFGGMPKLMAELDKLKGLDMQTRLAALKEVFGDDSETLQVLSKVIDKGADGYNEAVEKLARQATLQQRVNAQLGTLKNLWDAASGSFTNTLASVGELMAPELKQLTEWFGDATQSASDFIAEYPGVAKVAGLATAGIGGLLLGMSALAVTLGTVTRLGGYAMSPLAKVFSMFGRKKGKAGAAGEAAGGMADAISVQRVFVVNWPGGGMDFGGAGGGKPGTAAGEVGKKSRLGRLMGSMKNLDVGRLAGRLGAVAALGAGVYGAVQIANDKTLSPDKRREALGETAGSTAGGALGGWGGAAAGAALGTMLLPGIGSVIGGLLGGLGGGTLLGSLGGSLGKSLAASRPDKPSPAPTPLNPAAAAAKGNATAPAAASTTVQLNYSPTLTIQGDPIPGTKEKFARMLSEHKDIVVRMVQDVVEQKARTAYSAS